MIEINDLKTLIEYDAETGLFLWLVNMRGHRSAGEMAGSFNAYGYRRIKIKQKAYLAHRLAWAMHYKEWPQSEIDHINGNRADNRICNLRLATRTQNCQNNKHDGVSYDITRSKWLARICVNKKQINLGRFSVKEDAINAVVSARKKFFGEFCRDGV